MTVALSVAIANAAITKDAFGAFRFKCSTATVCVDLAQCDVNGIISRSTVSLSPEEEEARVPLVPCRQKSGGDGYCCRDPDYKDDWPADYKDPGLPKPTKKPDEEIRPTPAPTRKPVKAQKEKIINTGCPERNRVSNRRNILL